MSWKLQQGQLIDQLAFEAVVKRLVSTHLLLPTTISFEQVSGTHLTIDYQEEAGTAQIKGAQVVHFYRGLGLLAEMQQLKQPTRRETMQFQELNFMLEASRNGVMQVEHVQDFIISLALMGYTGLYLYIEDTYELKGQPYFGYLRGKYSIAELKTIDWYAEQFGIEVVPCIQTLAHLTQALKWESFAAVREDQDTLLVGEPETYGLIDTMLETIKSIFRSAKVHIGMDESYGVGIGRYLEQHPFTERFILIKKHLDLVIELCNQRGLTPLVWSDFIYHTLDEKKLPGYYPVAAEINQKRGQTMPQDVTYVYWDYGEFDPLKYEQRLANHQQFAKDIMFAGGIHIYGAMTPNHGKSLKTLQPALMACKKMGVTKVMATTWGDNGQEITHWNALPIMQWYAEHTYHKQVSEDLVKTRFATCIAPNLYEAMMSIRYLDEVPGVEELNHYMANPSKFLLWQDPLVGLFEDHVLVYQQEGDLSGHYRKMAHQLKEASPKASGVLALNLNFYAQLASVLSLKATCGSELISAYQAGNREQLRELTRKRLPNIAQAVSCLRAIHEQLWLTTYKPFGWEVLDIRYGGLIQRLESSQKRLEDYLADQITSLPELTEKRLPFSTGTTPLSINVADYRRIAFTGYN